ncbi:MAG: CAAX prenyl protease-related protein [Dissulfuribacterales bacterium]
MQHILKKDWFPYVFPFVIFLLLTEVGRWVPCKIHILYVTKTIIVGALLWFFRHRYRGDFSRNISLSELALSIFVGLLCLAIWIIPESYLPKFGVSDGFDPFSFGLSAGWTRGLIAMRLIGAVVVVPIMEELFWRSFLLRYLVNSDFKKVALGTFTFFSFSTVALLFGLEHHRFVAGIIVGILYNILVVRQKKLVPCIVAHATTNLGLGIYVLVTRSWMFW